MLAAIVFTLPVLPIGAAPAQDFPTKPLRLVIGFAPGGSSDILGRAVGNWLAREWGQPVVIDNRPGAGGIIGTQALLQAPADGYTLGVAHIGTLAVDPTLYPKLPYDPVRDLAPVSLVARVPNVLVVNPGVPAKTLAELIALARARPGVLTYGSGGIGSAAHLAGEYFRLESKTDVVHVPYKGTGPSVTDLISGQLTFTLTGVPPVIGHLRTGRLRALAVASDRRLEQLPGVPTMVESGMPGFVVTQWYGIVAPAGTPPVVVAKLSAAIARGLSSPEMKQRLEGEGAEPVGSTPEEFARHIRAEIERWRVVIRAADIKPE